MDAVLFDLDGTLLDIDIDSFMDRYMRALSEYSSSLYPDRSVMDAVMAGVRAMMGRHPGTTNERAFFDAFEAISGIDLADEWDVFDRFYAEQFDGLQGDARPRDGAREALDAALAAGMKVAIATNPMFPEYAIRRRMTWAQVHQVPVDLVTTYESSRACKPHPEYYTQVAEDLGVEPEMCLMVGDDMLLDMPAADVGMRTFYVGSGPGATSDHAGDMHDVARLLESLAAGA